MALGQMPARGAKGPPTATGADRAPRRRVSQELSYDPSEASEPAELPAQPSRRDDAPSDTGRPLVRPAVYSAHAYGGTARRKSVQALEEEMRAKEMRECSFAPKLTKPPAYLKWNKEKRPARAPAPRTRGSSPPATRRAQRVREMLEERQAEEQKE